MLDVKDHPMLMSMSLSLSISNGVTLLNPIEYQQVIGNLQNLSLTKLDIAFVIPHTLGFSCVKISPLIFMLSSMWTREDIRIGRTSTVTYHLPW